MRAAVTATAQTWTPEQQAIWQFEDQQWKAEAAKDASWIDTMVHPNLRIWSASDAMPRGRDSLKKWSRIGYEDDTTREYEIFPISATITGNVAVVQYRYMLAYETYDKKRKRVSGRYTDVLVKENGRWMFLSWTGGEDPGGNGD